MLQSSVCVGVHAKLTTMCALYVYFFTSFLFTKRSSFSNRTACLSSPRWPTLQLSWGGNIGWRCERHSIPFACHTGSFHTCLCACDLYKGVHWHLSLYVCRWICATTRNLQREGTAFNLIYSFIFFWNLSLAPEYSICHRYSTSCLSCTSIMSSPYALIWKEEKKSTSKHHFVCLSIIRSPPSPPPLPPIL